MNIPEPLQELLARSVGPFTVLEWIGVLIAMMVLSRIWSLIAARARARRDAKQTVFAKCYSCGWSGKVSRFHRACPKCGDRISSAQ